MFDSEPCARRCGARMGEIMDGKKHDIGKLDWSLLDLDFVEPMVAIFALGEERYDFLNWQKDFGPAFSSRFQAARMRHSKECQYNPLAVNEDDGGVYHLAQVAWNALQELYHARKQQETKRCQCSIDDIQYLSKVHNANI